MRHACAFNTSTQIASYTEKPAYARCNLGSETKSVQFNLRATFAAIPIVPECPV